MRIQWKKTSVGGYMAQHTGFMAGERSAMIIPDGEDRTWHVAVNVNGVSSFRTVPTAKAGKAWVKRLWGT